MTQTESEKNRAFNSDLKSFSLAKQTIRFSHKQPVFASLSEAVKE